MGQNIEHRNCHNCKHLEFVDGEREEDSGWICAKRDYKTTEEETLHLKQLDDDAYLFRAKRCHESKQKGGVK